MRQFTAAQGPSYVHRPEKGCGGVDIKRARGLGGGGWRSRQAGSVDKRGKANDARFHGQFEGYNEQGNIPCGQWTTAL